MKVKAPFIIKVERYQFRKRRMVSWNIRAWWGSAANGFYRGFRDGSVQCWEISNRVRHTF